MCVRTCGAVSLLLACAGASGEVVFDQRGYAEVSLDISGMTSVDALGSVLNTVVDFQHSYVMQHVLVVGVGWDVEIDTNGISWLSEAGMHLSVFDGGSLSIVFFPDDAFPGTAHADSGGVIVLDPSEFLSVGMDNTLRVEFFESYDDITGEDDAVYLAGSTVTFGLLAPAPGALGVVGAGMLVAGRCRRS